YKLVDSNESNRIILQLTTNTTLGWFTMKSFRILSSLAGRAFFGLLQIASSFLKARLQPKILELRAIAAYQSRDSLAG
ncbi:MAG TPA: hypothetical protein VK747_10635, partial [Blastocatellia bacterium]|nr:hypothetical protein [Blastocatellia bacterium]